MPILRLIADDLTGTLDTAAGFTGLVGPVEVAWIGGSLPAEGSLALDTGTRERGPGTPPGSSRHPPRFSPAPGSRSRKSTACCAAPGRRNSPPASATGVP